MDSTTSVISASEFHEEDRLLEDFVDVDAALQGNEADQQRALETYAAQLRRAVDEQYRRLCQFLPSSRSANDATNEDAPIPEALRGKFLSSESTFAEVEAFIKGIGTEDLGYLETLKYRAPKQGKETYNLLKSASSSLAGTTAAYLIGNALGLPTGFIFGTQLGDIVSKYVKGTVGVFETGERPLGQEFVKKWVYLKESLKEKISNLDEKSKQSALDLQNLIDYYAAAYVKPTRTEEVTAADLDIALMYVVRYAFILTAGSLKTHPARLESSKSDDRDDPYLKRLEFFDPVKRAEIKEIEGRIRKNCDPKQKNPESITIFLGGPGGTGKTTTIEAQAAYVGIPFKRINLTAIPLAKLRSMQNYEPLRKQTPLDDMVGLLATELVRMGSGIIFIDEAADLNNKEVATFWKSVLQENPVLPVPVLGTSIDLSRFVFFFAANIYIEDSALRQRLGNLPFDGLSKEEKMNAANDRLESMLAEVEKRSDLEVKNKVRDVIGPSLDYLVELDLMRNSGGRVIKKAIKSLCLRLEDAFKADSNAVFSQSDIEKMIVDIYRAYPAEDSLDVRAEATAREPALQFLKGLLNKVQGHASHRATLEKLVKDLTQAKIGLNDEAMLLIASGLSDLDPNLKIENPADQQSALYLLGCLGTVTGRHASVPEKTLLGVYECLGDLMSALENETVTDPDCRIKLLTVMRDLLNFIPNKGDFRAERKRNSILTGLRSWGEKTLDLTDSFSTQLKAITG